VKSRCHSAGIRRERSCQPRSVSAIRMRCKVPRGSSYRPSAVTTTKRQPAIHRRISPNPRCQSCPGRVRELSSGRNLVVRKRDHWSRIRHWPELELQVPSMRREPPQTGGGHRLRHGVRIPQLGRSDLAEQSGRVSGLVGPDGVGRGSRGRAEFPWVVFCSWGVRRIFADSGRKQQTASRGDERYPRARYDPVDLGPSRR
jgi:hypothetical protein